MTEFAVIFDMDGVLIDTVRGNFEIYNQILKKYGVQLDEDDLRHYVGKASADRVAFFSRRLGVAIDFAAFEKEADALKAEYFKNISAKPGVVRLLDSLKREHIPIALGTSSTYHIAKERLGSAGIWEYFSVKITDETVAHHKPAPDVYAQAIAELGVASGKAIVVEDSPFGITAAHAAGAKAVGVITPDISQNTLEKADMIVGSLEDVSVATLSQLVV